MASRVTARCINLAVALLTVIGVSAGPASAVDHNVQLACADDYFTYCSRHDPDGPGVRNCMRANGRRLSQRCINALAAAGEISQTPIKRRFASAKK